jgi:transposase
MAFSMEFRLAAAAAYRAYGSSSEVAEELPCSASWVRRLIQVERRTGSLAPKPLKLPDNNKLGQADLDKLARLITQRPDIQLRELAEALGGKVSVPTIYRARKKLGFTRKKSPCTPPSRTGRT